MYKRKGKPRIPLPAPLWAGLPLLDITRRVNRLGFDLLLQISANEDARRNCAAVFDHLGLWAQIDARACERAARCPFLLMDLHFLRVEWWQLAGLGGAPLQLNAPRPLFTDVEGAPILREILAEAWRMARSTPRAASLLFGMAPAVSEAIAKLSVPDVDRIVSEHAKHLRPRWEESRTFWSRLLQAAIGTDDDALTGVHLHSLGLLGGEYVPRQL
jgi:hypothetical protein